MAARRLTDEIIGTQKDVKVFKPDILWITADRLLTPLALCHRTMSSSVSPVLSISCIISE